MLCKAGNINSFYQSNWLTKTANADVQVNEKFKILLIVMTLWTLTVYTKTV